MHVNYNSMRCTLKQCRKNQHLESIVQKVDDKYSIAFDIINSAIILQLINAVLSNTSLTIQ